MPESPCSIVPLAFLRLRSLTLSYCLQTIKRVELQNNYIQDPSFDSARFALKRIRPTSSASLLISFKLPYSTVPLGKTFPVVIQEAFKRLVAAYISNTTSSATLERFEKCAWVESSSFLENTVSLLCTWNNGHLDIASGAPKRRLWQSSTESSVAKLSTETLVFEKLSDSDSSWKYDPSIYEYNESDKTFTSGWNVTLGLESILSSGRFSLDGKSPSELTSTILNLPRLTKFLPATVKTTLRKDGMHRELATDIQQKTISPPTTSISCRVGAVYLLSDDFFVDQYEVEENARFGGPNTTIYRDIDLEKPNYLSSDNIVVVSKPIAWDANQASLVLPIHYRYQLPQQEEPHTPISIRSPVTFTYCWQTSKAYPPIPNSAVITSLLVGKYPTLPNGHIFYVHHSSTPSPSLSTSWPNGVWNDEQLVSVTTFALTLAMSALTIGAIFKSRSN